MVDIPVYTGSKLFEECRARKGKSEEGGAALSSSVASSSGVVENVPGVLKTPYPTQNRDGSADDSSDVIATAGGVVGEDKSGSNTPVPQSPVPEPGSDWGLGRMAISASNNMTFHRLRRLNAIMEYMEKHRVVNGIADLVKVGLCVRAPRMRGLFVCVRV